MSPIDLRPGNNWRIFIVTATSNWVQLPALDCIGVLLRTPAANAAAVLISYQNNPPTNAQGSLAADRALSLDINDTNLIWIKAASGSPTLEVWAVLSSAQP